MSALQRREQIVERMKIRKFDTACNLSIEFGVSKCTIYRDMQELSVNGYPIQANMGNGGGIRWFGGKRQFPFSQRELLALHNAIALVSQEEKPVLESLLCKNIKPEVDKNDVFGILADGITQRALAATLELPNRIYRGFYQAKRSLVRS